ncbi:MAG: putative methyltransferase [Betaproteobacteria bacterium]|jgi:predicted SAM-dependent methyltransferase|nr:putative methyltransferase [Betaproteobacteria bacterium]
MKEESPAITKLNLGCGPKIAQGWLNCDIKMAPGVDLRMDLRTGVPLRTASVECIAGIHILQDLSWQLIGPALRELHRVLRPGCPLRLAVPDLDKAIRAYLDGDSSYFYVPDRDARNVSAKLVTQIVWYGSVRTPLTFGFLDEWLRAAGFVDIERQTFRESVWPGLAMLDNRERESLFVEARKPPDGALAGGANA